MTLRLVTIDITAEGNMRLSHLEEYLRRLGPRGDTKAVAASLTNDLCWLANECNSRFVRLRYDPHPWLGGSR